MMRAIGLALVAAALLLHLVPARSVEAREPERGSAERAAIVAAVRGAVERDLGPPVVFTVRAINVDNGWAYLFATPRRSDRDAIDWSRTRFASAIEAGFMSDAVMALLHAEGDRWKVIEYVLGPSDVAWEGWVTRHRLPQGLFTAAPAAAAPVASAAPASTVPAGWQAWRLGDLAVATPRGWASPEAPATALRLGARPWMAALSSSPQAVEHGILVVMSWASPDAIYSTGLDAQRVRGRSAASLAGHAAIRTDFVMRDAYNDTQGIDLVTQQPVNGGVLHAGCRAPSRQWSAARAVCEQILASVSLSAAAPVRAPPPLPQAAAPPSVPSPKPAPGVAQAPAPVAPAAPAQSPTRSTARAPAGVDPFDVGSLPSASHAMPGVRRP